MGSTSARPSLSMRPELFKQVELERGGDSRVGVQGWCLSTPLDPTDFRLRNAGSLCQLRLGQPLGAALGDKKLD